MKNFNAWFHSARYIVDEREVLREWRKLFHNQVVTAEILAQAEALLDGLSGESPLHLRLASELQELQHTQTAPRKKSAR